MAGINLPLTLYVARHGWASAAKTQGHLGVISEGVGRSSETTTRIYLASLDTSMVKRANFLTLSSLRHSVPRQKNRGASAGHKKRKAAGGISPAAFAVLMAGKTYSAVTIHL